VEDALGDGHVPGEQREQRRGDGHEHEAGPEGAVAGFGGELVVGWGCLGGVVSGWMDGVMREREGIRMTVGIGPGFPVEVAAAAAATAAG
jgi:hypothetical protein